jgi:radical SAM protein with 4Fe4S-binding SPASM domain
MFDYSELHPHLENRERRGKLLQIEKDLVEHPFPPQLVVENTSYCNLKCIHCSHQEMTRKPQHMERDLWNKIVSEVATGMPSCELWPTFYGEALILKDELWNRLDFAAKAGCKNLVLNSNGTLLNRWNNYENILSSPLKRFILSLDGFSKEVFEKVRHKAKWDTVYPSVEELCRKHKERGLTYPVIIVQFSVMEQNAHEVEDFSNHWKSFGAEVKVRPMLEWGSVGSIRTKTIKHDDTFRIACPWANNTMAIHQDGSVVACAVDYDRKFCIGNIRDMTIKEAWHILGEHLRSVHKDHLWDQLPDICKSCGDWQTAGATYEEKKIPDTRPFWYQNSGKNLTRDVIDE